MRLSYILSTRNKLPYLKIILNGLVSNRKPDEEIIIIDAESTDGTRDYLEDLFQEGKIQKYLSEPDFGEAHGTNKALLLATGDFIKIVTDDDLFSFSAIEQCVTFMEQNPRIDVLMANGGKVVLLSNNISRFSYEEMFHRWANKSEPFAFCGLGLLFRKSSLPLLGLFNNSFVRTDAEYALRITSNKKVQLGMYTGTMYLHVANKNSNTNTLHDRYRNETKYLEKIYDWGKKVPLSKKVFGFLARKIKRAGSMPAKDDFSGMDESYAYYEKWLKKDGEKTAGQFLYKKIP